MVGTIMPMEFVRLEDKLRAAAFGVYPISRAISRIRAVVSGEISEQPRSALDTAT
jgi:hypothetical protein